jgi:hypothetical protein
MSCTHWWQKIKSDFHIPPKKGTRIIMFNPINNRFRETIQTYHQTYQSLHENKSKKNFPWKLNSLFFSVFPPLNQFWQNRKSLSPSWHLSQGDALPTSGGNRNPPIGWSQKGVPFWPFWHFWPSLLAENNIGARLIWGEWNCMNIRLLSVSESNLGGLVQEVILPCIIMINNQILGYPILSRCHTEKCWQFQSMINGLNPSWYWMLQWCQPAWGANQQVSGYKGNFVGAFDQWCPFNEQVCVFLHTRKLEW